MSDVRLRPPPRIADASCLPVVLAHRLTSVSSVPGDFNLEFLDYIEGSDSLDWVGNANELSAAYSSDG